MRTRWWSSVASFLAVLAVAGSLYSYPGGYGALGTVQTPGSDALSVQYDNFAATSLAQYLQIAQPGGSSGAFSAVATTTPATTVVSNISNVLNSGASNYLVRFYFVSSSAAYNNTIAFSGTTSLTPGQNAIVFSNANVTPAYNGLDPNAPYAGAVARQFVSIGEVAGGTQFNLALLPNAATGFQKSGPWWTTQAANSDGAVHASIVQFTGTNYYLIAWEDLPASKSDFDYNDVIMVAEVIPLPEPSIYILGAFALGIVAYIKAKKMKAKPIVL